MLIWNPSKLTTLGKELLAKAQSGKCSIQITKAQSGNGSYTASEDLAARTSLKSVKQTFAISNKVINTNSALVLKITMENTGLTAGYDIKEFGIFAQDPDRGEILYSIATASTSDYMPAYNGIVPSVINMSYYLEVTNASSVTIKSAGALALQSDLEALETRVSSLESDTLRVYGAKRKVGASSTSWERYGAAKGLIARAAVGNGKVQNDFMESVYPYNSVRPCNVASDMSVNAYMGEAGFKWDGSNGNVMLEVPKVYTARYFETDADGVKWEHREVAGGPVGRCRLDHAFTDGGVEDAERIYLPIFNGSLSSDGSKLESKAGAIPAHNKTRAQFRTLAKANGDDWYLDDVWGMHLLDTLFIVMFAGTNAQAILGSGRSSVYTGHHLALQTKSSTNTITIKTTEAAGYSVGTVINIGTADWNSSVATDRRITSMKVSTAVENATEITFDGAAVNIEAGNKLWACVQSTGATIDMQSANGRVDGVDGRTAMRFLYIEDWYANMWQFRDGDNIQKWQHYYCNKRSSYADKVYSGDYFKIGYEAAHSNGYVKEFGYDPEWPEVEICINAEGSSGTYFPDYYYQSETGEVVFSGGNVGDGTLCGPFYRACSIGSGNSSWNLGGRPQGRK